MSIKKSTSIFESIPFVHCLNAEKKRHLCDYCFGESLKLLQCSKCKYMHYCGQTCQRSDWSIHKHECNQFVKFMCEKKLENEFKNDLNRLFLRLLIQSKINNKSNEPDTYKVKTFDSLIDHYDDLVKDIERVKVMQKSMGLIKELMGIEFVSKFTIKELISAFGKMIINSLVISSFDLSESIGSGIYLSISSLDHSCEPNSIVTFNGIKAHVRTIRDLELNEKPFISYCEILMTKKDRQNYLLRNYYFECKCVRCTQKIDLDEKLITLKWKKKSIKIDLCDNESIRCCLYEEESTRQDNKDLLDLFNDINSIRSSKCTDINMIETTINKLENESNIYLVKLYECLLEIYLNSNMFKQAAKIARQNILPAYKTYLPENHPSIGLLLTKIVKLMDDEEIMENMDLVNEAKDILRICFSPDSVIFNQIN